MLATLERGIKGGKWYSLMDKVWSQSNLERALGQVCRNKGSAGVDGQSTEALRRKSQAILARIEEQLRHGEYEPQPVKRQWIEKLGSKELRPLGIPTAQDRVVQTALRNVIEPIFEHDFAEHSYGFRPGRGAKDALRRVDQLLQSGRTWVVDADLKGYFDSIPQNKLMEVLTGKISDGAILELIQRFLRQGVMESAKEWKPTEEGTPQGAVISPLLANIYLDPFDHLVARAGWELVRYADDFVVLCASEEEARKALEQIQQWVASAGLVLHPTKTRIMDASQKGGFDFLGYHFERGMKWPRQKSLEKAQRNYSPEDWTDQRQKPGTDHCGGESHLARMVWLFQAQPEKCVPRPGQLDTQTNASHPAQTPPSERMGADARAQALAQCLLRRTRAVLDGHSPRPSEPTSMEKSLTGEPDAGNPPVRFGGRGGAKNAIPTPIYRDEGTQLVPLFRRRDDTEQNSVEARVAPPEKRN